MILESDIKKCNGLSPEENAAREILSQPEKIFRTAQKASVTFETLKNIQTKETKRNVTSAPIIGPKYKANRVPKTRVDN